MSDSMALSATCPTNASPNHGRNKTILEVSPVRHVELARLESPVLGLRRTAGVTPVQEVE